MRSILKKLATILVSILIALGLVEALLSIEYNFPGSVPNALRLLDLARVDQEGVMSFVPGSQARHPSFNGGPDNIIPINKLGFRGSDPSPQASIKVAVVGDSVVFNGGVDDADTFEQLVQNNLAATFANQVQILNYGVSSTNLREYVLRIRHRLKEVDPKIVVVGLYLNDLIDPPMNADFKAEAKNHASLWRKIVTKSFLLQTLRRGIYNLWVTYLSPQSGEFAWVKEFNSTSYLQNNSSWEKLRTLANKDWGSAWQESHWQDSALPSLQELKDLANERGFTLLVMLFPVSPQVYIKEPYADLFVPQQQAKLITDKLQMHYLDLLPAFRKASNEKLFNDQCHLTKAGNLVVAQELSPVLLELIGRQGSMPLTFQNRHDLVGR